NEISPYHSSLSEQCDEQCDGRSPCARCLVSGTAIREYSVSFLASKAAMKPRIEQLETRLTHSDYVLHSQSGKTYAVAAVLKQLNEGDSIEKIHRNLVEKQASDSERMSHGQEGWELSPQLSGTGSEPTNKRVYSNSIQDPLSRNSTSRWTTVTTDFELVRKLHLLYFSWDHSVCSVLSKYHFIKDRDTGRQRYCSPLLVNIMAALGCRFSDRVKIKTNFDGGERFYLEAERIWGSEQGDTSIATIQATALMSLWEASQGQDSKAYYYSRQAMSMAVEGGLHNRSADEKLLGISDEVCSATFWGVFVLDQIWSLYSGHIPHLSCRGTFTIPPLVVDGQDLMDWAPYYDDETQRSERTTQTSNVRSVFRGICELSHIIYQSLHIMYSRKDSLTSREVMDVYGKYLNWYESMLGVLKSGVNSTPTAIFAHLLYHFGLLILFGPLIGVCLLDSSVMPDDICSQAADAINSHIWSYRELYSLRRIHAFIPYISLSASVAHLVTARNQSMTSDSFSKVTQGISSLEEMMPSNAFAGRAADALRRLQLPAASTGLLHGQPEHESLPFPCAAAATGVHEPLPGPESRTQHVRPRRRPPRPQLQPEPSPEPGLRAALGPAAATIPDSPCRRPRVPAPATAAAIRADPLEGSAAAQPTVYPTVHAAVPGDVRTRPAGAYADAAQRHGDDPAGLCGGLRAAAAAVAAVCLPPAGAAVYETDRDVSGGVRAATWGRFGAIESGAESSIRGPPRKPAQSGHALWVGNLSPVVSVLDMKEHFAQGAREEILSVFLIAKSSCAFVNYRTEEACASAVGRFHASKLGGVRLVCRLRRSAMGVVGGVPTGPASLSGVKIEGVKVEGEEVGSATTPDEETPAKYFIVKSLTVEDLEMSVSNGVWATQSQNEAALNKAYETAETVYLIFSVNKSGEYYGYARMTSPVNQDPAAGIAFAPAPTTSTNVASATTLDFVPVPGTGAALTDQDQPTATVTPASTTAPRGHIIDDSARGTIFWEADSVAGAADEDSGGDSGSGGNSGGSSSGNSGGNSSALGVSPSCDENLPFPSLAGAAGAAWGRPFSVEWESTRRVPFFRTRGLKNAWNAGREVKIARDGTEIETRVGRRLIELFGGREGEG
ncbi:hypothetical protein V498_08250, partial [Pseudogymnoascus sp. VKM F-4517 (FW-2822)]